MWYLQAYSMSWQDFADRSTPTSAFETILIPLPRIEDGGSPSINLLAKELVFHTRKGLGEDVNNLEIGSNIGKLMVLSVYASRM